MRKIIDCLLQLLENPFAEKGYRDLKKCYQNTGMDNEAAAVEHLIQRRYKHETNSVPDSSQERNDNRTDASIIDSSNRGATGWDGW